MKLKMFYLEDEAITQGTMLVAESEDEARRQYEEMVGGALEEAEFEEQDDNAVVRLYQAGDPIEPNDGPPEARIDKSLTYGRKYIEATVRQWLDWYESKEITFAIVYEVE